MAGTKKNFLYNMILTVGNYIFPLLTYPYVSRVLGVENIGVCNYVDSIINYFVLFSTLGIGSLGVREIARIKNDKEKMNEVFSSLLSFNVALMVVAVIVLLILTFTLPFFEQYKPFLLVGVAKLMLSPFLIEWFYQGISNFKYITIRSLAVRTLYVILVFVFIHSRDDVLTYFILSMLMGVINALFNINYSRKFVLFSLKDIHIGYFLAPILSYGLYAILTSMYTSFNVAFLGSVTNPTQVGYFTTATKLHSIILSVFTALTTVMVPKVSEMLGKGESAQLKSIANRTFAIVYSLTIPLIVVCCFYAPLIIRIIAGAGYEGAITPFRIVIMLVLIIGMEQIVIRQFLMAVKDSKCIIILSATGAIIGLLLNFLLVPSMGCIGSAISWTTSELSILLVASYFFKKHFSLTVFSPHLLKYLLSSLPYIVICYFLCDNSLSLQTIVSFLLIAIWFIVLNVKILPNEDFLALLKRIHLK